MSFAAARITPVLLLLLALAPLSIAQGLCTCAEAREKNGWCAAHEVGYVAGVEIRSEELFESLDAHGHVIDREFIDCTKCLEARDTNGFCTEHQVGWVDDLAYLSTLTYHLARGNSRNASEITCPVCKKNSESYGWCSKCNAGQVGPFEIRDPESFRQLSRDYETLLSAKETVARCELCASAMVVDGRCPVCKISYRNGKPAGPSE